MVDKQSRPDSRMQGHTQEFHCRACGHAFSAARPAVLNQPTCPKCRTFGQLVDAQGHGIGGGKQNVVRVQNPGSAPYASSGGANYGSADEDVVEISASAAYGGKNNKNLVTSLILVGLGIGIVCTMFFIVSILATDHKEEDRQQREVVQDPKDFERAVDESVSKVRALLKAVPGAQVQETTNFDEITKAIMNSGGVSPGWAAAPKPGQPFRAHGFTITAEVAERNNPTKTRKLSGFVMLLYYKTADEVKSANTAIEGEIGGDRRNYSISSNPAAWYVSYGGYDYSGIVKDAVDSSMRVGTPVLRQFTDRTGSTLREDLK